MLPFTSCHHANCHHCVCTALRTQLLSQCGTAQQSWNHGCHSTTQPHFRGVSAISLCHADCRRQASLHSLAVNRHLALVVTTVAPRQQPLAQLVTAAPATFSSSFVAPVLPRSSFHTCDAAIQLSPRRSAFAVIGLQQVFVDGISQPCFLAFVMRLEQLDRLLHVASSSFCQLHVPSSSPRELSHAASIQGLFQHGSLFIRHLCQLG